MKTNNIEELINQLDPTKTQCNVCEKWISTKNKKHVRFRKVLGDRDIGYSYTCTNCFLIQTRR